MLYEVHRELAARLEAKGVPYAVVYGPERTEREGFGSSAIVVDVPMGPTSDRFDVARGNKTNPAQVARVTEAAFVRIYARDEQVGAAIQDHRRLALQLREKVVASLIHVLRVRKQLVDVTQWTGGFIDLETMEGTEAWPGAVYEIPFVVERGLFDSTWEGAGRPTIATPSIRSRTDIAGTTGETACNSID